MSTTQGREGATIQDGMIVPADDAPFGFTPELFGHASYLWREGDRITISFIECQHKGRGDFSRLVKAIEAEGLRVAVPTPLGRMDAILTRWGFIPHTERFAVDIPDPVEVWERPANTPKPAAEAKDK